MSMCYSSPFQSQREAKQGRLPGHKFHVLDVIERRPILTMVQHQLALLQGCQHLRAPALGQANGWSPLTP